MPQPVPVRVRSWKQRLRAAVMEGWPLKLAAIFFALVLWLVVSAEEPTEEWVDVRLALIMDSTVALRDSLPNVQALVVGRGRDLLKLYAETPVIRRVVGRDTPESVVLDLRPNEVDVPNNIDARVRDIRPRQVELKFAVAESRYVPVRLALDVVADSGVRLTGPPRADPDSVLVRGPRTAVHDVVEVRTVRQRLVVHDTLSRAVPLDTAGLGVHVMPDAVRIRTPITVIRPARDTSEQ